MMDADYESYLTSKSPETVSNTIDYRPYPYPPASPAPSCPNCGYCPTCGRSNPNHVHYSYPSKFYGTPVSANTFTASAQPVFGQSPTGTIYITK